MPSISSAYRGPLIIMGLGGGFSVVGAVPVAITISIGVKTSATVIGMGFVAFGFLLMLPGFFWCIMVRTHSFKVCWKCCRAKGKQNHSRHKNDRRHKWNEDDDDDDLEEEETPALCYNQEGSQSETPSRNRECTGRERKWPPVYVDTPSLMITGSKTSSDDFQLHKVQSPSDASNRSSTNDIHGEGDASSSIQRLEEEGLGACPGKPEGRADDGSPTTPSASPPHPGIVADDQPRPSPESCQRQASEEFDETAQRISNEH